MSVGAVAVVVVGRVEGSSFVSVVVVVAILMLWCGGGCAQIVSIGSYGDFDRISEVYKRMFRAIE